MKGKLKKIVQFISIGILVSIFMGCSLFPSTGSLSLSITDAPINDGAVEGVYITISGIEYNLNEQWIEDSFTEPKLFNLLELTNGEVAPLSDLIIDSGTVSQIRFLLDTEIESEYVTSEESNPGCYIIIDQDGVADGIDDTDVEYPLFIPSGAQTGYKLTCSFTIPSNGEVEITADFDVRKSVVKKGVKDEYLLKPTIRLVVNNQAGSIDGDFIEPTITTYDSYVIFTYASGEYSDDEISLGSDSSTSFPNSISSTKVIDDHYVLSYLANGEYDLIIVGVDSEGAYTIIDDTSYQNITVQSGEVTAYDINLNPEI